MNNLFYSGSFYMTGTLRFYTNWQIGISTQSHHEKRCCNKYVILKKGGAYDAFSYIANKTHISPDYCAGDPIWVHPGARLSRDLIRKSGYNITRDKEKAEFIVLPEPDYNQFSDISYHIACKDGNTLYFFTVNDVDFKRDVPDEKFDMAKQRITQYLKNESIEFLCDDMRIKTACFFPFVEEYRDLIEDKYSDKNFVFDTKLKLSPNVDISVETLDVWARLEDHNMLSRFICASDWKDYPLTLKLFLESTQYGIKYQKNNNIRMIVRELGIGDRIKDDMVVTPKDYNMLISYVFHLIGKPVGSTYITEKDWSNIPVEFKRFLKRRIAISPVSISQDEIYDNIVNSAKN